MQGSRILRSRLSGIRNWMVRTPRPSEEIYPVMNRTPIDRLKVVWPPLTAFAADGPGHVEPSAAAWGRGGRGGRAASTWRSEAA